MATQTLSILNSSGVLLSARLDTPDGMEPVAYAIFAHCFTCTKNLNMVRHISRALTAVGIAVLRFDFTGHGESEGEMLSAGLRSNVSDLKVVSEYLGKNFAAPGLLIGHSLGGAAAIAVAGQLPSVQAVVTIGAPARLDSMLETLKTVGDVDKDGQDPVPVKLGVQEFMLSQAALDEFRHSTVLEEVAALQAALLVIHSPDDRVVDMAHADMLFAAASHPKSFMSLESGGHMLVDRGIARHVGRVIASWAAGVLEIDLPGKDETFAGDGVVNVHTGQGFQTEIVANGFSMRADEPASLGGTETGPTPYDFVCAGLGACTSITLRMYADRKQWPLASVDVQVTHAKVRASERDPSVEGAGRIDQFTRLIRLHGELSEEQRARLLEIADRCPVHRTLEAQAWISTALVDRVKEQIVS